MPNEPNPANPPSGCCQPLSAFIAFVQTSFGTSICASAHARSPSTAYCVFERSHQVPFFFFGSLPIGTFLSAFVPPPISGLSPVSVGGASDGVSPGIGSP